MPYLQKHRAGSPLATPVAGKTSPQAVTSMQQPAKEFDERPPVLLPYVEYPLRDTLPTPIRLIDRNGSISAKGVIARSRNHIRSHEQERHRVKRGWASKLGAYQPLGKPELVLERKPPEEVPKPTIIVPKPPVTKKPPSGIHYKLLSFDRPMLGRVAESEYAFYSGQAGFAPTAQPCVFILAGFRS